MDTLPAIENINEEIENFRQRYKADDLLKMLDDFGVKVEAKSSLANIKTSNEADLSEAHTTSSTRATGRGASRGAGTRSRGGAASTRTKAKLDVSVNTKVSLILQFYL